MKLGVFTVLFSDKSLEETLDKVAEAGLDTVEIGCGGYPGDAHCKPQELLEDESKLQAFKQAIESRGLEISNLSVHGNPLHPNKEIAQKFHDEFVQTVKLASKLGVQTVTTFSGCPGESENSKYPSWVTCPWPDDFLEVVEWQWNEKVIPYWKEQDTFLKEHNVRVAIESHPGFVVYNTETMLRLRNECGDSIGCTFDPSHLFWQQMDPILGIKELAKEGALFHFHAKDTGLDSHNVAANGVLDTKKYTEEINRSWIFRTVGYGNGEKVWRDMISTLQLVNYEGAVSIEHEDSLMSVEEGFYKAAEFLKAQLIKERLGDAWWV